MLVADSELQLFQRKNVKKLPLPGFSSSFLTDRICYLLGRNI